MMLWIFGMMALGSAFIIGAWTRQAYRHRKPLSPYNATLLLAVGFDIHAIGTAIQAGVRVVDILRGASFPTTAFVPYLIASLLVIAGKTCFVWVASLNDGRDYSRLLWWSYLIACGAWSGFALTWHYLI